MKKERDVFISYHTSSAKELVIKLGDRLERSGVSCWYAPRDCDGNFDEAIMEGLGKAHIFLLIINRESMESEHVKNEIHAAFDKYIQRRMALVVFQIDDCPVNNTVKYFLGRVHRINGFTPPIDERIEELVGRIIQTKNDFYSNSMYYEGDAMILSSTIVPSPDFVGRAREISEIFEHVKTYKKIFVSGMGGIGKSGLMRQFAVKYKENFRSISWGTYNYSLRDLVVSDTDIRISGFKRMEANEDAEAYFKRKYEFLMTNGTEDDLLIIDNYDVESDAHFDMIMQLPVSIIFTTRIDRDNDYKLKRIDNNDELYELFKKGYPRTVDNAGKRDIEEIIKILDGHTLAIRLISVYMRDKRVRPADMVKNLKQGTFGVLDGIARANQAMCSVYAGSDLGEKEKTILYNLTFVPVSGIEAMDFFDLAELEDYAEIDELIAKNWVLHNPSTDYISLHSLIRDLCLSRLSFDDERVTPFLPNVLAQFAECDKFPYEKKSWLYLVNERIAATIPTTSKYYNEYILKSNRIFHVLSEHAKIIERLSAFVNQCDSEYHKLYACMEIASSYRCREEPDGLRKYLDMTLSLFESCDALSDEERIKIRSELIAQEGWYYTLIGDFERALEYNEQKLAFDLEHSADDKWQLGWAYNNIGNTRIKLGYYKEAAEALEKGYEIFGELEQPFGQGCCMKTLARGHLNAGDFDAAIDAGQKACELLIASVGEKQMDVAISMVTCALAHKALGNIEAAQQLYSKARAIATELHVDAALEKWKREFEG